MLTKENYLSLITSFRILILSILGNRPNLWLCSPKKCRDHACPCVVGFVS
jgi:hypothetical protein